MHTPIILENNNRIYETTEEVLEIFKTHWTSIFSLLRLLFFVIYLFCLPASFTLIAYLLLPHYIIPVSLSLSRFLTYFLLTFFCKYFLYFPNYLLSYSLPNSFSEIYYFVPLSLLAF